MKQTTAGVVVVVISRRPPETPAQKISSIWQPDFASSAITHTYINIHIHPHSRQSSNVRFTFQSVIIFIDLRPMYRKLYKN